jgi:nitroreductase
LSLFEVVKKRLACRHFKSDKVPKEMVDKILDAARMAPTASNGAYRRLMVVDDPRTIKVIRQVSPSLIAKPPALLLIMTDLDIARRTAGNLGDVCGLIDAGAVAENATLACTALGLGSGFARSNVNSAIREILDLPSSYRCEVVMPFGFPEENQPPPVKRRKDADLAFHNSFRESWA